MSNGYEVSSVDEYIDEEGHKRMIIRVLNWSDNTEFDIMVRDTGLVYVMEDD